jgi:D-alanyl-D-alanine carboxypeptidase
MFRKKLVFYFFILLLLVGQVPKVEAATPVPKIYGNYGVVIDAKTGEVLYSKQGLAQWYPASMTKILTAMLLLDSVKKGTMMTASKQAVQKDGSNSYFLLKAGEKMSREDALKALLVLSCNDVASMIAEHVAGSEAKFSILMNKKAKEIGAKNSYFVTPSGLHHPKHKTTSYDMALLMREALQNYPEIMNTIRFKHATVHTSKRTVKITNRAQFFTQPNVIGGKTGYTNAARNSLVEIVRKNDVTLIGVVMKSTKVEQYKDLSKMTNYSFSMMQNVVAVKQGQPITKVNLNGSSIPLIAKGNIAFKTKKDSKLPISIKESIFPQDSFTSIIKGKQYGEVTVWKNGVKIGTTPLIATMSSEGVASSISD